LVRDRNLDITILSCLFLVPTTNTNSTYVAGMRQVTSYPLALLKLVDESYEQNGQPLLGKAKRLGVNSSTFDVPVHKILAALITHAQSPETIAKELNLASVKMHL